MRWKVAPIFATLSSLPYQILDSCYQELTELDGSEYVAEMDNLLHFDLSMITQVAPGPKLLNRQSSQKPPNEK